MVAGRADRPIHQGFQADGTVLAGWCLEAAIPAANLIGWIPWGLQYVRHRELFCREGPTTADAPDRQQQGIDRQQALADGISAPAADSLKGCSGRRVAVHVQSLLLWCEVDCTDIKMA